MVQVARHWLPDPNQRSAASLPRRVGLTQCSTGHLAAARAWPSFHSGPSAVCRKAPVNANVRPRGAKPLRVTVQGDGCNRGGSSASLVGAGKLAANSTLRYSRRRHQYPNYRSQVGGSRFARQCCAWQSASCGQWRSRLRCRWRQSWRSDESTADVHAPAPQCGHGQRHQVQRVTYAECLA